MRRRDEAGRGERSARLEEVPVDAIVEPGSRLRRRVGEEGMESLRASIAARGILVPLVVVEAGEKYRLVCGLRRYVCAVSLDMATVPALVVAADAEWERWAMHVENREREEVNVFDEALWLRDTLELAGIAQESLAACLGVSAAYVSQRVGMFEWPEDVRGAVASGEISFSVGRELCGIGDAEYRLSLIGVAIEGGCSARQAATWRREWESRQSAGPGSLEEIRPSGPELAPVGGEHRCALCGESVRVRDLRTLLVCTSCQDAATLSGL